MHELFQFINDVDEEVYTWCRCGAFMWACNRDDQLEHALSLGYLSVWAMNREHDTTHFRLSRASGMESPTLMRLVHDNPSYASPELIDLEEAAVLAFQRFWNAARGR